MLLASVLEDITCGFVACKKARMKLPLYRSPSVQHWKACQAKRWLGCRGMYHQAYLEGLSAAARSLQNHGKAISIIHGGGLTMTPATVMQSCS